MGGGVPSTGERVEGYGICIERSSISSYKKNNTARGPGSHAQVADEPGYITLLSEEVPTNFASIPSPGFIDHGPDHLVSSGSSNVVSYSYPIGGQRLMLASTPIYNP